MDKEDYLDLVKNQIELDKLLHTINHKDRKKVEELFQKKKEIIKKNGVFADFQLRKINKKIDKFKNH